MPLHPGVRARRGFKLIELIIVIAIIATFLAAIFVSLLAIASYQLQDRTAPHSIRESALQRHLERTSQNWQHPPSD